MSHIFVHLSDIHFGQEKGGQLVVNNDVKDQIILDVRRVLTELNYNKACGIIISGDIAYGGEQKEYDDAGVWLDRLTAAAGCERESVQVVPGNHDIDRSKISLSSQMIVDDIVEKGDEALDKYLASPDDREILYHKFSAYRVFAEAYNCPLDSEGSIIQHKKIEIAPGRFLKFHGVNTSLICSKSKNEKGSLLLGQRQRVIPQEKNSENIIIAHHPLHWLQDSEDALLYIKNRALIFISGHEHLPRHKIEKINDKCDLLQISSGATVPPNQDQTYTYCYNLIEFKWDNEINKLHIFVHPRRWKNDLKKFEKDEINFADGTDYQLYCPNFDNIDDGEKNDKKDLESNSIKQELDITNDKETMNDQDPTLILRFFRELSSSQRLEVLVAMKALPEDLSHSVTHAIEAKAIRKLMSDGKSEELKNLIEITLSHKL